MKKLLSLMLCLLLICIAGSAMADYQPGDTVSVTVTLTGTSAPNIEVLMNADNDSVLIFQNASLSMAGIGTAPRKDNAYFTFISSDFVSNVPTGVLGTATYKIADDAAPGTYKITLNGNNCTVSGSVTVVIAAKECTEHVWDAGKETTAPTCTAEGVKTYTCTNEGCTGTKTEAIPAAGHKYESVVTDPTCTEGGYTTHTCSVCKDTYKDTETEATGHKWDAGKETTAATCTADGVKTYTCTVCKETKTEAIPAKGHIPSADAEVKEPTCTEDGYGSYKCTVCGVEVEGEKIPATGHKLDDGTVTTEPTCAKPGVKTFACTNEGCDYTETKEIEKLAEHTWDEGKETTAATCTADGVKTYTCTVCKETKTEAIPAKGHIPSADAEVKEPTCTEDGYGSYKCTVCGVEVEGEKIPATGHKWDEGKETTAPTCEKDGVKTYTCTNDCGETKTEAIPAIGHKWDEGKETTAPTCEKDGVKTYTCANAGCTKTEKIPATGHKWDAGKETTAPTCEKDGVKTYTCTNNCGETKTEKIAALGHKWDEGKETTAPTCTADGVKTYTCANAGCTKTEKIPATGHTPGEWIVSKPVTDTEDGVEEQRCTVCNELLDTRIIPNTIWYHMTVSSVGPRFRDVSGLTNKWNMFSVVDISKDGEQVFDLVAGNLHVIGKMTVKVADGSITVTCALNSSDFTWHGAPYLAILPGLEGVKTLNGLTTYNFGEPISIADQLGGDTVVLIYVNNTCHYPDNAVGLRTFKDNSAYDRTVDEMMKMLGE